MIWVKTDAGRVEIQLRARLKDRHLRALLVLVDGKKSEEAVLQSLPGSSVEDLAKLRELGLIGPVATDAPGPLRAAPPAPSGSGIAARDFADLVVELKVIISAHLGLGGLGLTLALEQATSTEELAHVAQRAIEQIEGRQGLQAPRSARAALKRLLGDQN